MMRSLFSAVSGLRNHQTKMDVIGHNIANVNTVGYKPSRVIFQEIYSQTLQPAAGPSATAAATRGGTNPNQVGLGMKLASIDVMQTASTTQITGETLDLAINDQGYFLVQQNNNWFYTRGGNFSLDAAGNLVTHDGGTVMGFNATIPANFAGETQPVIDTGSHADYTPGGAAVFPGGTAADPDDILLTDLAPIKFPAEYKNISINQNGEIVGEARATGQIHVIGYLPTATFENPKGLTKYGNNLWMQSINSGTPVVRRPGEGDSGTLSPGGLEMANVDIAQEMTEMITTQRGFQANARIITVSDSMLEELVNLKR